MLACKGIFAHPSKGRSRAEARNGEAAKMRSAYLGKQTE